MIAPYLKITDMILRYMYGGICMVNKYKMTDAQKKDFNLDFLTDDIVLCVDAENKRAYLDIYIGGYPHLLDSHTRRLIENDLYTLASNGAFENITDADKEFCSSVLSIEKDLKQQIMEQFADNLMAYDMKISEIEQDGANTDSDLMKAVEGFQSDMAEYLDNNNILTFGWGTDKLIDIVKDFVQIDNVVTVDVNGHTIDITLCFEQDFDSEEYFGTGKKFFSEIDENTYKNIAEAMSLKTDYFLSNDKVVNNSSSLMAMAQNIFNYKDIELSNEQDKFEIAKWYMENKDNHDALYREGSIFSDWYKDNFHHRPHEQGDLDMLEGLYREGCEKGVYGANYKPVGDNMKSIGKTDIREAKSQKGTER